MVRSDTLEKNVTARPLLQPEENPLTISYSPSGGEICAENPPRLQWIAPQVGAHRYDVEIKSVEIDGADAQPFSQIYKGIKFPFFTPNEPLESGRYEWRYRTENSDKAASEWSVVRQFGVKASSVRSPSHFDLDKVLASRPRLAILPSSQNNGSHSLDSHSEWTTFLNDSVTNWTKTDIREEPAFYPDNIRTAALWRKSYIACQEMFYAIRNLSIAGVLQQDDELLAQAKAWLLSLARWDVDGATSHSYNDESAFRCATALAWGYDWLFDSLSETERAEVRLSLLIRGRQIATHVIQASRIDTFPFDSHAVRAVSAVLVPVGLALAGEEKEADHWLEFAVGYLMGPFSAWGDSEGGWAEGIHYWTTAMCYALEAVTILKNVSGMDLYQRPFFQKTGQFPMYCRPAWTKRATFGDDSTLGDAPSPKIARNMRLLALATKSPELLGYATQIEQSSTSDPKAFYNYGWWDFAFDDLLAALSFGKSTGKQGPKDPTIQVFPDVGWASMQSRMDDPDHQIHCVFKSSPYGSLSHSHADQNAFCLSAFGEDLLVQSGYYVSHNSSMHRNWRRQTLSKNALLIDGRGQYAGDDKLLGRKASGEVLGHGNTFGHQWVIGDATVAYQSLNKNVKLAQRHMHFVFGSSVIIVDVVEADTPVPITWLGHTHGDLSVGDLSATVHTDTADLGIEVIYSSAAVTNIGMIEGYDNVDKSDYEGLEVSRRVEIDLEPKRRHLMATMLSPIKKGKAPKVHCFVDDQGFGKTLYCLYEDNEPVRIPLKSF